MSKMDAAFPGPCEVEGRQGDAEGEHQYSVRDSPCHEPIGHSEPVEFRQSDVTNNEPIAEDAVETAAAGGHGEAFEVVEPQRQISVVTAMVESLPPHLHGLAKEIRQLNERDLVMIADMTDTVAKRDVYSLLPYTGSNWFLPMIEEVGDGERRWWFRFTLHDGMQVTLGGRRLKLRLLSILLRLTIIVLLWFTLWNILPHWLVEPGGCVWDPLVTVVVAAIVGGVLCRFLQIPPLVGVLWIAIMWNNIPELHYLTEGIVPKVKDISSKMGLTVILARAGFSLTLRGIRPHWIQSILLATMPFALEGVSHSLIANQVFGYRNNYNWAFLQGIVCSIVSPAVVVPGTLYLQQLGYGRGDGPLSLLLSAVGVEICVGVWAANFIIGLIFYNQRLVVAIVLGPVQLLGGAVIGVIIGLAFCATVEILKREAKRLPNGKYQRDHFNSTMDLVFVVQLSASLSMVFLGYGVSLPGGGAVMCVLFNATITHMWTKDRKRELEEQKRYIGSWLAFTWDNIMMPFLFAMMGAKISVTAIFNATFFPKAVICLVSSTAVRLVVTFAIQLGSGTPWRHRFLVCVGYLGKASAQASVGPLAASLVAAEMAKLPQSEWAEWAERKAWANNVEQMSALYVMFMAACASLGLVRGGMLLLEREADPPRRDFTNSSGCGAAREEGSSSPSPDNGEDDEKTITKNTADDVDPATLPPPNLSRRATVSPSALTLR